MSRLGDGGDATPPRKVKGVFRMSLQFLLGVHVKDVFFFLLKEPFLESSKSLSCTWRALPRYLISGICTLNLCGQCMFFDAKYPGRLKNALHKQVMKFKLFKSPTVGRTMGGVIRGGDNRPFHTPNQFVSNARDVGAAGASLHRAKHNYKISCSRSSSSDGNFPEGT